MRSFFVAVTAVVSSQVPAAQFVDEFGTGRLDTELWRASRPCPDSQVFLNGLAGNLGLRNGGRIWSLGGYDTSLTTRAAVVAQVTSPDSDIHVAIRSTNDLATGTCRPSSGVIVTLSRQSLTITVRDRSGAITEQRTAPAPNGGASTRLTIEDWAGSGSVHVTAEVSGQPIARLAIVDKAPAAGSLVSIWAGAPTAPNLPNQVLVERFEADLGVSSNVELQGTPCAGSVWPAPLLTSGPPAIPRLFELNVLGVHPNTPGVMLVDFTAPSSYRFVDLDVVGAPGCSLFDVPSPTLFATTSSSNGTVSLGFRVPRSMYLAGRQVGAQYVSIEDVPGRVLPVALTNAVVLTLGR